MKGTQPPEKLPFCKGRGPQGRGALFHPRALLSDSSSLLFIGLLRMKIRKIFPLWATAAQGQGSPSRRVPFSFLFSSRYVRGPGKQAGYFWIPPPSPYFLVAEKLSRTFRPPNASCFLLPLPPLLTGSRRKSALLTSSLFPSFPRKGSDPAFNLAAAASLFFFFPRVGMSQKLAAYPGRYPFPHGIGLDPIMVFLSQGGSWERAFFPGLGPFRSSRTGKLRL